MRPATSDDDIAGVKFSGQVIEGLDPKELRGLLDQEKQRLGSGIAAVCATNDGKAAFAVAVTDDLTGRFSAVDLVRAGVEALGGKGGGGRPDMAQGGGPDGANAGAAIEAVKAAFKRLAGNLGQTAREGYPMMTRLLLIPIAVGALAVSGPALAEDRVEAAFAARSIAGSPEMLPADTFESR